MNNLCKTELLRHCNWMMTLAIAHFCILYYMSTLGVAFTDGTVGYDWIVVIALAAGIFGVFQMKLHRRSSDWVYLLHRPLPPARIHLALTLAGSTLLVMALLLPALLMLVIMHIDGQLGIELRHYQMLAAGGAMVLIGYSLGQFAVLGTSRLAFLAVLLAVIAFEPFAHAEQSITVTSVMLLALMVAHVAFKADLERQSESAAKLLLAEVPIAIGCYMLLLNVPGIYIAAQTACDFSPEVADHDSCIHFSTNGEQLQFALAKSAHPDGLSLVQQSKLAETISISSSQRSSYPQRNQLPTRDARQNLFDSGENTGWRFRHSSMLYAGHDMATGEFTGWLAPDGFHPPAAGMPAERFGSVPLAAFNEYLVDDHHIYQLDWQQKKVRERFTNGGDERFSDSLFTGENIATIFSDRHLYIFNAQDLRDADIALNPRAVLDITSPVESGIPYSNNDVTELSKGYLVTARLNAPRKIAVPELVPAPATLQVWRAVPGAAGELITELPLKALYSEASIYAGFVLAPGVRVLADAFEGLKFAKSNANTFPLLYADFPSWVVIATLAVCGLSAGFVAWLLRGSKLPASIRRFWIIFCGLTGLPGLLIFIGGHYWRRHESLKLPLPARSVRRPTGALA